MRRFFPFLEWFRGYGLATLRSDFVAGLTVALVLVPQSMAYAQLAGLPAYYGLYAALLPPMVASLFGSSRQLATGPVAVVSLMTAAALEPLATAGSGEFIAYAILLALMVGVFQLLLGTLRLGLVVNLLSHPVVNGFTNAAALIIATSQLNKVFGVSVDSGEHHYETVYRVIVVALHSTHLPTLAMAALAFAIMVGLRRVNPRIPNVLVAVVVTTVLAWATGYEHNEKVKLDRIASDRIQSLVRSFDSVVAEKQRLVELRAGTTRSLFGSAADSSVDFCQRCHPRRDLEEFHTPQAVPGEEPGLEGRVFALHQMAGVVDSEITGMEAHLAPFRDELRAFRFDRVTEPGGAARFYLRGEVPPGMAFERGSWQLRVGTGVLGDTVTLIGGGSVVGTIPKGLPPFKLPTVDLAVMPRLLAPAIIISILGFMEAISIAKAMAARTRQRLDPNQELIGQGLANIVGCIGQGYAVSGSFSRSAVNLQAGARTGMSNVISSGIVMVVLLFLSRWLYYLPQAVLAAIIMMAVVSLLNVSGFLHAWRAQRFDGVVSIATFLTTLVFAPELERGIALGVLLSLGAYLLRTMRPRVSQLAPHPDGALRDISRHGLRECPYLAVVSFDGPLNFASTSYLEDVILTRVSERPDLRHLLIAGHRISEVDASGEETLRHLVGRLRAAGFQVSFSGLNDAVLDVLRRTHLYEVIGEDHMFGTQIQAITILFASAHAGGEDPGCPFRTFMPRIAEVSLHPDGSLRDARRHELPVCSHIACLRFDGPLNSGTVVLLEEEALSLSKARSTLRQLVFVMHGVSEANAGGAARLALLVANLREVGLAVAFSGFKDEVLDLFERTGTLAVIGPDQVHPTQVMAVAAVYARAHRGSDEGRCALRSLAPRLTELSVHPDGSLRDARRHGLGLCRYLAALRFDGPLVFASPGAMQDEFAAWRERRRGVTHALFVAHTLHALHAHDANNLLQFADFVRASGIELAFTNLDDHVFEVLARSGVVDRVGLDRFYSVEAQALAAFFASAHAVGDEERCPLEPILPRVTELSLHPDGSLRDARRHGLARCRHIVAIRFDGPLNFATMGVLESELKKRLAGRGDLRHVLLTAHTIERLDAIAAEELCRVVRRLREGGFQVSVSGLRDEVLDVLVRTGGLNVVGADRIFPTQARAIAAIYASAHAGSDESPCPLIEVVPAAR